MNSHSFLHLLFLTFLAFSDFKPTKADETTKVETKTGPGSKYVPGKPASPFSSGTVPAMAEDRSSVNPVTGTESKASSHPPKKQSSMKTGENLTQGKGTTYTYKKPPMPPKLGTHPVENILAVNPGISKTTKKVVAVASDIYRRITTLKGLSSRNYSKSVILDADYDELDKKVKKGRAEFERKAAEHSGKQSELGGAFGNVGKDLAELNEKHEGSKSDHEDFEKAIDEHQGKNAEKHKIFKGGLDKQNEHLGVIKGTLVDHNGKLVKYKEKVDKVAGEQKEMGKKYVDNERNMAQNTNDLATNGKAYGQLSKDHEALGSRLKGIGESRANFSKLYEEKKGQIVGRVKEAKNRQIGHGTKKDEMSKTHLEHVERLGNLNQGLMGEKALREEGDKRVSTKLKDFEPIYKHAEKIKNALGETDVEVNKNKEALQTQSEQQMKTGGVLHGANKKLAGHGKIFQKHRQLFKSKKQEILGINDNIKAVLANIKTIFGTQKIVDSKLVKAQKDLVEEIVEDEKETNQTLQKAKKRVAEAFAPFLKKLEEIEQGKGAISKLQNEQVQLIDIQVKHLELKQSERVEASQKRKADRKVAKEAAARNGTD